MRILTACAAALLAVGVGCGRSDSGARSSPVWVALDPDRRTSSIGGEAGGPKTPPEDLVGYGGRAGGGAKGEWPEAREIWAGGRDQNPHIVIRVFDAERNAVRVEVTYAGPPSRVLKTVVFRHVSKSEGFRLKSASGETDYNGHSQEGEDLHLRWPESGDGKVTFLAWPHVH